MKKQKKYNQPKEDSKKAKILIRPDASQFNDGTGTTILEGRVSKIIRVDDICIKYPKVKYQWDDLPFEYNTLRYLNDLYKRNRFFPVPCAYTTVGSQPILVYRYLQGDTLSEKDIRSEKNMAELGKILRKLHKNKSDFWGNSQVNSRTFEDYIAGYASRIRSHVSKSEIPLAAKRQMIKMTDDLVVMTTSLEVAKEPVLVHGDLKPGNVINSSSGISLIDWGRSRYFLREYETVVPAVHGHKELSLEIEERLRPSNYKLQVFSAMYHIMDLMTIIAFDGKSTPTQLIAKAKALKGAFYSKKSRNIFDTIN